MCVFGQDVLRTGLPFGEVAAGIGTTGVLPYERLSGLDAGFLQ